MLVNLNHIIIFLCFYALCDFLNFIVELKIKTKISVKKVIVGYNYISKSIELSEDLWSLFQ